jgi:polysaccharide chain length determinant protein (PEP-CTERM system associated)
MKLDLKFYLSIFMRRSPYFIVITALFTSIGISVAMILPAEYQSQATLLIESEQIPSNLAATTVQVQAAEQLQIIEQRLMTRANLLDMANRLELYERGENEIPLSAAEIVDDMRSRTTFNTATTVAPSRRQAPATTILTISYRSESPSTVATVANEFVTLVLQENVEIRTEQAGDTLEFFEQEVERLGTELDTQSARLLEYQSEVGVALPANLDFLRTQLNSLEADLADRSRQIAGLEDQKERLSELFQLTGGVQAAAGQQLTPLEQRLDAARQALADAELIYSETNPKRTLAAARVAQLEKQVAAQVIATSDADADASAQQVSQQETIFNAQIADIDAQIELLKQEVETLTAEIAEVEDYISQAPANGVGLSKLQRDFDNIQTQYNTATARLSAAATGERIELLAKGQRISVIEQAVRPERPTKPNRALIAAGGAGAGMAVGLGLIVLLEILNQSIRRPIELNNRLGITPIAVLPYIRTEREVFLKRLLIFGAIAFLLVGIPLAIYAFHTLVKPVDTIIEPILNRAGYSLG